MKLNPDLARDRMVLTAARWLPERGMAALNLIEVARAVNAPRGSLYHYFPGGRDQLLQEALALARHSGLRLIEKSALDAPSASACLARVFSVGASWLNPQDYAGGCPIAAAVLSAQPESTAVRQTLRDTMGLWEAALRQALVALDLSDAEAEEVARSALIAFEGALVHAKGTHSMAAFQTAAKMVQRMLPERAATPPQHPPRAA